MISGAISPPRVRSNLPPIRRAVRDVANKLERSRDAVYLTARHPKKVLSLMALLHFFASPAPIAKAEPSVVFSFAAMELAYLVYDSCKNSAKKAAESSFVIGRTIGLLFTTVGSAAVLFFNDLPTMAGGFITGVIGLAALAVEKAVRWGKNILSVQKSVKELDNATLDCDEALKEIVAAVKEEDLSPRNQMRLLKKLIDLTETPEDREFYAGLAEELLPDIKSHIDQSPRYRRWISRGLLNMKLDLIGMRGEV